LSAKLFKSTALTGGMTLISRISGLVRDVAFANLIGASAGVAADAFYVAFRIPNFFRRIFGEGAFAQAFVPVMTEHKDKKSATQARLFVDRMAGTLGLALFVTSLVGVLAAPWIITVLASGFIDEPDKFDLSVQLLRITFPYLFFISMVSMAAGILNTYGRFGAAAFTPVLLNLCLITAALIFAPLMDEPVIALAWGVFAAGLMQLLFQIPFLRKTAMLPRPRLRPPHTGVSKVLRLMGPAIIGSSAAQVNMLVNTWLASFLMTGGVSWLFYSDRLMEFPLGVFGIALATVILPSLSRKHARQSKQAFSDLLDWALRWAFIIALPATVGLIVLAGPLLTTLFQYGKFSPYDVKMASQSLMAFAVGLPGFILVKVLAPGFYARQNTRTPAKIAVVAMVVNVILSLALFLPLAHAGLALAVSIAAILNAGLLYGYLRRERIFMPLPGWWGFLGRLVVACVAMGSVLLWGSGDLGVWLNASIFERVGRLALWVAVGVGTYFLTIRVLGINLKGLIASKPQ